MRRAAPALFLALVLASTAGAAFSASDFTVGINQSRRLMLRGAASNVIVSDPAIADVAVLDSHSLLVMGRGYGSTDLLVLDHGGRTLFDGQVLVAVPDENRVTVHHGDQSIDYACSPRCQALASTGPSTTTTTTSPGPSPAPTGTPSAAPSATPPASPGI